MVWMRVVLVMLMCSDRRKALPTPLNKYSTAAQGRNQLPDCDWKPPRISIKGRLLDTR